MLANSPARAPRPRIWRRIGALLLMALVGIATIGLADAWTAIGTLPSGARSERSARSPQFRDGKFVDTLPRVEPDVWRATLRFIAGTEHGEPLAPLPVLFRQTAELEPPVSGLRITWFGHSTLLVEIEGRRVLIDPVFGERCSPSRFSGPKRFHRVPMEVEALPRLDAVVISHDHYDHLDYETVARLRSRDVPFLVPLGVGAHLAYWGIPAERIHELDWWQEVNLAGLRLVATPARHFSGRGLGEDRTLWSGWALITEGKRVYYSGDTAMFEGFAQIGARLGPFDAAMIEVGAYDAMWADVHLGPEQAIQAHRAVGGGLFFPVHWGTFNLALHTWVEPVERTLVAAREAGVDVATPRPGQTIDVEAPAAAERWWPNVPWKPASEAPVVSSGVELRR